MATKKRKRLTNTQKVFIGGTILLIGAVAYNRYKKKHIVGTPTTGGGSTPNLPGYPVQTTAGSWGSAFGTTGQEASSFGSAVGSLLTPSSSLPRGLRNNNPLNIIITSTQWQGEKLPNTDGKFKQFESIIYGYRAGLKNLQAYFNNNWNTIRKITSHWAPAGSGEGNNPESYARHVSERTGIGLDTILPFSQSVMIPIVREMAVIENGNSFRQMIRDNDIKQAWNLL